MLFWGGIWVLGSLILIAFFIGADNNNEDYNEEYADYYEKEEIHKEMKL